MRQDPSDDGLPAALHINPTYRCSKYYLIVRNQNERTDPEGNQAKEDDQATNSKIVAQNRPHRKSIVSGNARGIAAEMEPA